ncbi:MAG: hypothetical protein RSD23_09320, partial [Ruthenibacterium sp.]
MEFYQTPSKLWCVTQTSLSPSCSKQFEGLLTQGSGYIHARASYEEGLAAALQNEQYMRMPVTNVTVAKPRNLRSKFGTYMPGITGNHPLLREEIVNLPNPWKTSFCVGEEPLDMDSSEVSGFERTLDLRDGVLYRSFLWHTKSGLLQCDFSRFISRAEQGLFVQKMTFCSDCAMELQIDACVDADVTTNGYCHFTEEKMFGGEDVFGTRVTIDSGNFVTFTSLLTVAGTQISENHASAVLRLVPGEPQTIYRFTMASSSRDLTPLSHETMAVRLYRYRENPACAYAPHAAKWA